MHAAVAAHENLYPKNDSMKHKMNCALTYTLKNSGIVKQWPLPPTVYEERAGDFPAACTCRRKRQAKKTAAIFASPKMM